MTTCYLCISCVVVDVHVIECISGKEIKKALRKHESLLEHLGGLNNKVE